MTLPQSTAYGWLMLAGIGVSIAFWSQLAKRDDRLLLIYLSALAGAFLGAKLVYVASEGWLHFGARDMWLQLATGKSILGALPGGYLAVEIAKKCSGYRNATGDWFAAIVPFAIVIGRVGCLAHGCCLGEVSEPHWWTLRDVEGLPRFPAVPVEMLFNLGCIAVFAFMRKRRMLVGQHFHLYLIAYGMFRFGLEFFRATPKVLGVFSGYQIAALAVALLGAARFAERMKEASFRKAGHAANSGDAVNILR